MKVTDEHGKMLTVRSGFVVCPECRHNKQLARVTPETEARRLPVYCRMCRKEIIINITRSEP